MGISFGFLLLTVACGLALALVVMASRRIQKEGLTLTDNSKRQHFKRSVEDVQRKQQEEQAILHEVEGGSAEKVHFGSRGFGKQIGQSVKDAAETVKKEMESRGFALLQAADVGRAVKNPELPESRVLLFYHRELAGKAVLIEPAIGLLHTVVLIRQDLSDDVHLEFSDPLNFTSPFKVEAVDEIAAEIKKVLVEAMHAIE